MTIESDFRKAVFERAAAIVAERLAVTIEESAQAEAAAILAALGNGAQAVPVPVSNTPNGAAHTRRQVKQRLHPPLPKNPVLVRGGTPPSKVYRERTDELRAATLAWDSLHPDGHFKSGRAERMDLTRYLSESLPDLGLTSFSSWITRMVRNNVLAVLPPGF